MTNMKFEVKTLWVALAFFGFSCQSRMMATQGDMKESAPVVVQEVKRPKNVILMIGDGMGLVQITAGMVANGNSLNLERINTIGLIKTPSSNSLITDSAAGATAFASGKKTYNGAIGVDDDKKPLVTLLELAVRNNMATGLVATSSITHATPAAFVAHQPSRKLDEAIANDLVNSGVDIFMGGGRKFFERRADSVNLIKTLEQKNYKIYENVQDVNIQDEKVGVFIAPEQPISMAEGRGDFLPVATAKTVDMLRAKNKGFFLMVEGSQIDWKGHDNLSDDLILEMKDFDVAVGKVLDFAEKDGETLVIITADHETGGYAIVGGSLEEKRIDGKFVSGNHTGVMVPVFAYGPGAEAFGGIYENTEIFHKILEVWEALKVK